MTKTDDMIAAEPPKKRRALESADARHLAIWAADESLPPSARRRAQEERDRRKAQQRTLVVGVLEDAGGSTPEQVTKVTEMITGKTVAMSFVSKSLNRGVTTVAPVQRQDDVLADAQQVIGLVNGMTMPERKDHGIWKELRHAKDKGVDVIVIWPDGSVLQGRW